jgi:hypothetical protein
MRRGVSHGRLLRYRQSQKLFGGKYILAPAAILLVLTETISIFEAYFGIDCGTWGRDRSLIER